MDSRQLSCSRPSRSFPTRPMLPSDTRDEEIAVSPYGAFGAGPLAGQGAVSHLRSVSPGRASPSHFATATVLLWPTRSNFRSVRPDPDPVPTSRLRLKGGACGYRLQRYPLGPDPGILPSHCPRKRHGTGLAQPPPSSPKSCAIRSVGSRSSALAMAMNSITSRGRSPPSTLARKDCGRPSRP
jgi:hypothetical protein